MALDDLSWARIAFTSAIAALVYGVMRLIQVRHSYKDLPKPPHSFLFGHLKLFGEMFGMLPNDTHYQVVVTTIAKKYNMPGIFYLDLWPVSWSHLVVIDPDVAMEFTVTRSHPKHEAVRRTTDPLIGKGNIASAEGPHWKHLHKMMSPAFSITNITEMRPIVATEVMKYRSILQEKAKSGKVFRLEDLAHHLTFDIISRAATGRSFDTQTKGSLALQHFEAMVRASMKSRESFNYIGNFFANRVRDRERRKLDALVAELIKERFDFVKNSDLDLSQKRGLCIMDLMLRDYFQSTGENKRTELDSEFLTNAITQVKTLLIAGSGTTSDTVCFGHMLLSVHPEVVQKMREEHDHVFAPGIDATYDLLKANPYKMNDLVYTIAVIKEILRFYPIGNTAREGMDTLTYQGQQWPSKGKMVCPVQLAMHMDPKHFEDPLKFDPERFIRQDYTRIAWRPFERGPRACIGKTLAMDELTLVFLLTARDFDFACADLKPNKTSRTEWNNLDLTFGDRAYQEFVFEASPRDGMPMTVKNSDWPS